MPSIPVNAHPCMHPIVPSMLVGYSTIHVLGIVCVYIASGSLDMSDIPSRYYIIYTFHLPYLLTRYR